MIANNQSIKVATIIQHFDNEKLGDFLAGLALEEIILSESELTKEFDDIVSSLKKADSRKELNILLEKLRTKTISPTDNKRLQELTNNPNI